VDLIDRIGRWGAAAPGRTAHLLGGQEVTYGELLHLSDLVASHVTKSLPDDRSPVAVKGHKEPGMLACFLGSVKAGHPYIPIDAGCLTTGGTLFSLTRDDIADPRQMYRVLSRSGVTSWVSTPSFAGLCLMEKAFNSTMMPSLTRFMFYGETLSPEVPTLLLDRFPCAQVWNLYGPTEATVATTSVLITREGVHRYQALPVRYGMPGTQVMVVDEDGQPAPEGDRGESVIAGPNVSPGTPAGIAIDKACLDPRTTKAVRSPIAPMTWSLKKSR
jgi:non-ribosomal peptide synthetase component F